jgi:VanZ family protein
MKKTPNRMIHLVPMVVIMGAIFFLSHLPGDSLYMPPIPGFDKIAHMAIYAVLAATVLYAFYAFLPRLKSGRTVLPFLLTISICILYGIGDEFHQSFIPDRSVSFADVVADTMGAAAVCAAWFFWKRRGGAEPQTYSVFRG